MSRFLLTIAAIVLAITFAPAATNAARPGLTAGKPAVPRSAKATTTPVEFEMMTWPEVKQALVEGRTTALFYNGYPRSSHAGIPDTSEMLYLGGDTWVRKGLLKTAVGDPVPP